MACQRALAVCIMTLSSSRPETAGVSRSLGSLAEENGLATTANSSFDAVVVGAGIVGAACAKELAEAGLRVAICEQNGYAGGGATAAGMGHLAIMDDSDAQFALTSYSQSLWRELAG